MRAKRTQEEWPE